MDKKKEYVTLVVSVLSLALGFAAWRFPVHSNQLEHE